jgi:histidinol-phosphate phosphatase family protein
MNLIQTWNVDKSWTLFLDRDGVLNVEKHLDYIRNRNEFVFYEGVVENFFRLHALFGRIVIVTNQRGIGKGLMKEEDLKDIHHFVSDELARFGAKIDAYYFAPDLDTQSPNRKPNTGMGYQAKQQFPEIDFEKSIMVGNNLSDMQFGKQLQMKTVYVETTHPLSEHHEWIDLRLPNFASFLQLIG